MFLAVLAIGCVDYELNRRTMVDSYVQSSRQSGVDILWVVDNSASMFEEQEQLGAHTAHFTDYLTRVPVEFQLGVITTDVDVDSPGMLVDNTVLTRESSQIATRFADLITMDEGSRDEYGFETTIAALDPSGVNGAVLNSSADLEIVFFSDEDEQSDMGVGAFVDALASYRPTANVVVNTISGDPPEGCASIVGAADPGFRYQEAQEMTGGLRESICSLHYDALLERIALKALGLENTFALNAAPDLDTLEVLVNGANIHRRERHGWQYDAGMNAIIFDGFAVPPPGADIVFRYSLWIGTEESLEAFAEDTGLEGEEQ